MMSVRKSPNMMSTTGRNPVIAAPTPIPVNPGSEIGVSITRSFPNSSTIPDKTLKGVPASATSSPMMKTFGSRRISSDNASRTASAIVSLRTATSGINILPNLIHIRIGGLQCEGDGRVNFRFCLRLDFVELRLRCEFVAQEPVRHHLDRIALGAPLQFFLFRAVIIAAHIANMMPVIPVGVAQEKRGAVSRARPLNHAARRLVHRANILPVHAFTRNPKSRRPRQNLTRRGLRKMRIFVVHIIFANVNYRKIPETREVHHFVEQPLSKRTFSEEAHGHLLCTAVLG